MPLNALGWSAEKDEKLVELVEPHALLYNVFDPSRKNILEKERKWQEIAQVLLKPVEECKKRWRGLRDGYMRSKRVGAFHKTKVRVFEKLQFLDGIGSQDRPSVVDSQEVFETEVMEVAVHDSQEVADHDSQEETIIGTEQQVITDNQEYYEITVVERPQVQEMKPIIKLVPKVDEAPKKIEIKKKGRKKSIPMPRYIPPVKILPKPICMNGPKIVRYGVDNNNPQSAEQRSQAIDKLVEKVLKENTNEIDVFFRSMAASVKKLQPNLIPKVKMEVCNVIAKYEMQNFNNNMQI